jgi:heat shock protein HslJ
MTRACIMLLLSALALPASAQNAAVFPTGQAYFVISINGFDMQKAGQTLTVRHEAKDRSVRGSGSAGCNTWSARVILREDRIDFTDIATTRKFCGQPRMKSEEAFLTALKSINRWRIDRDRLVLEGDAARLLLRAGQPKVSR